MPYRDPAFWSQRVLTTLQRYDEPLLRQVAGQLFKPRNQWPLEELIERSVTTVNNAAVIDRRLEALDVVGRRLLGLIGRSRQPRWQVGNLLELLVALGCPVDVRPILHLFEAGLLYPDLPDPIARLKSFEQWLGLGGVHGLAVFAHPHVTLRAMYEDLGLPECPGAVPPPLTAVPPPLTTVPPPLTKGGTAASPPYEGGVGGGRLLESAVHEADGLEWPLRLDVVWQQVASGPLRRTQQGDFFKRDLDRLRGDPLLNGPPANHVGELPDTGLLAIELALVEGVLQERDGEIVAGSPPSVWDEGLAATLESLWAALPGLGTWNAVEGWRGTPPASNPYPSAYLLAVLLLTRLPEGTWASPQALEQWVVAHHPYWAAAPTPGNGQRSRTGEATAPSCGVAVFLLGLAYQLRLVQAARDGEGQWLVRLSPLGRWLLGLSEAPPAPPAYGQTLLVQPNLELIAYRQGLTPKLVARLGLFAAWKNLGAACTLQLQPETVYRALEAGQTFDTILQTLEQHGMRPTPPSVVESLRTWANKRERIGIYPSATLFEFTSAEDLNEALARGLPGTRLSDRMALVSNESDVDFRHFRLSATRDYALPLEKCVEVEKDGVTLTIDLTKSDLLLETELPRFAEPLNGTPANGRRQYRLTPASLAAAQNSGLGLRVLEEWFVQRTGQPLSPSARLLLTGPLVPPLELRTRLVLQVSAPEVADGLLQWPGTRPFIEDRLGPTALTVAAEHVDELRKRLVELGLSAQME